RSFLLLVRTELPVREVMGQLDHDAAVRAGLDDIIGGELIAYRDRLALDGNFPRDLQHFARRGARLSTHLRGFLAAPLATNRRDRDEQSEQDPRHARDYT